ncbi:MAG: hypothetical protein E5Y32_00620 [Mesorhizobium sp.]|nr:MAG: hypothetical protein EOS14_16890 [Mesorhizobium sp.]TIL31597.1 MAG: hypothetical protein E5Y85_19830 [Mesorhizobium sp.]TIL48697.1 MAG: hypothetical protein E5Y83_30090 [Mesorhizobium sp.]TIN49684.1 MAG: hypothetical protein E5Y32_00620 [Mesorhizobium sp.]
MRGVPAWYRRRSVQHPSTVLALRANPPSPTRGEGRRGGQNLKTLCLAALSRRRKSDAWSRPSR